MERSSRPGTPLLVAGLLALAAVVGLAAATAAPSVAHGPGWLTGEADPNASHPPIVLGDGWTSAERLPGARGEAAGVVMDGHLLVLGGISLDGEGADLRVTTLEGTLMLERAGGGWQEFVPLPNPRDHLGAAVWDQALYVSGGSQLDASVARGNLWVWHPAIARWAALSRMPAPRYGHAMVALDGILYVVGGIIDGRFDHREMWAYDIERDAWRTDLAPIPTAREHLAAVVADGRIWALAGRMEQNLSVVQVYDPATDSWSEGPPMQVARSGFAAAVLPDGIHVVGGENLDTFLPIGSHEVLDLETMTWSSLPDLPTPRHGLASGVVDGVWVVAGGGTEVGFSTSDVVEIWSPPA